MNLEDNLVPVQFRVQNRQPSLYFLRPSRAFANIAFMLCTESPEMHQGITSIIQNTKTYLISYYRFHKAELGCPNKTDQTGYIRQCGA